MTFRGHSKKYSKIRINKTKGRERYGTFNRDSVRRAELRDGVYDPDIRRDRSGGIHRDLLGHYGDHYDPYPGTDQKHEGGKPR